MSIKLTQQRDTEGRIYRNYTDFKAPDDGTHCPKCGQRHTQECVDGGRCTNCGVMLCGILPD